MHTLCRIVFVERCQQRKLTKSSDIILPEAAAEVIGRQGGVQDVLAALRAFPNNSEIASNCCGALWSLAVNGEFVCQGQSPGRGGVNAVSLEHTQDF